MFNLSSVERIAAACVNIYQDLPYDKPYVVVFEGPDGTGKTTLASNISRIFHQAFDRSDIGVHGTIMPKYYRGEVIENLGDLNMYGRTLASAHDAILVSDKIAMATRYWERNIVLLDRHFYYSSVVYNMRHLDVPEREHLTELIQHINHIIKPDLVVAMSNKPFVKDTTKIAVMQNDIVGAYEEMWLNGNPFSDATIFYVNTEDDNHIAVTIDNIAYEIEESNEQAKKRC